MRAPWLQKPAHDPAFTNHDSPNPDQPLPPERTSPPALPASGGKRGSIRDPQRASEALPGTSHARTRGGATFSPMPPPPKTYTSCSASEINLFCNDLSDRLMGVWGFGP